MENFFLELFSLPPSEALYRIMFWYFGWLPIAILYVAGAVFLFRKVQRIKWFHTQKFIVLAIDVPENNEQSLRAVENLFTYLAGAHKNLNLIESWWDGVFQLSFSMEIVGIDGYIQYLVHTPAHFKHLIETAIYANYPDAEITEVEDYTIDMPSRFPDEEYDCWGTEFILSRPDMLPILRYKEFEHQFGRPETQYKDPLASLMDLYSSLGPGEQCWYQIIVIPTGFDWIKKGDELVAKIAGIKKLTKKSLMERAMEPVSMVGGNLGYIIASGLDPSRLPAEAVEAKKDEKESFNMMKLTPAQKKQIEGIQEKVSKMGFEVKIRMVYLAKKDVMNKPKVVNGFVGFIKQFTSNDLNGLKPDMDKTATSTAYFAADQRINMRKGKIIRAYKNRDDVAGRTPFIMNSEELATLWHFPTDAVIKAPLIQRAAAKRSEAPMSLPVGEQAVDSSVPEPIFQEDYEIPEDQSRVKQSFEPLGSPEDAPPDNLPVV